MNCWEIISGIGTLFTAIAALAAWKAAKAAAQQVEISRLSASVDALLRLDTHFNNPDMRAIRRKAASYLLHQRFKPCLELPDDEGKCQVALDDLLDFFEGIAFLSLKRKTPDPESVWAFFFSHIDHYYCAAGKRIEQVRKEDKPRWEELVCFHEQLVEIERRHNPSYEEPDPDHLRRFLEAEARLLGCLGGE